MRIDHEIELTRLESPLSEVHKQLLGEETLVVQLPAGCAVSSHNVSFVNLHLYWGGRAFARVDPAVLSDHDIFTLSPSWISVETRFGLTFFSQC